MSSKTSMKIKSKVKAAVPSTKPASVAVPEVPKKKVLKKKVLKKKSASTATAPKKESEAAVTKAVVVESKPAAKSTVGTKKAAPSTPAKAENVVGINPKTGKALIIPEKPVLSGPSKNDDDDEVSDGDSDDDNDDSDSEDDDAAISSAVSKVGNQMALQKRLSQAELARAMASRGVVYVGHLPRAFCEPEIKAFFGQFGTITRWRLSRSKKTGRPRGYAFIEFELHEIAQIAAKSTNKLLLWGRHKLDVKCLSKEDVKNKGRGLFKHWAKKIVAVDRRNQKKNREKTNNRVIKGADGKPTLLQTKRQARRAKNHCSKSQKALADLGVEYEFDVKSAKPAAAVTEKKSSKPAVVEVQKTEGDKKKKMKKSKGKKA